MTLDMEYGITIHRKQATRVTITAPLQSPPYDKRKDGIMNATTPPLFSEFIQMKKQNPSRYWTPATHAQMARSYQHHGPAYFDLHKDQSL